MTSVYASTHPSDEDATLHDVDLYGDNKEEQPVDSTDHTEAEKDTHYEDVPKGCAACSAGWTNFIINYFHHPILRFVHLLTDTSARQPRATISVVFLISVCALLIGLATNFAIDTDGDVMWVPADSKPIEHKNWIEDESGFPQAPRSIIMFFHTDGQESVLTQDAIERVFVAVDSIRNLTDYSSVCAETEEGTCPIHGVTAFWEHSAAIFRSNVTSDQDVVRAVSAPYFPDGTPVSRHSVFGYPTPSNVTEPLESASAYYVLIDLPKTDAAEEFESDVVDVILDLDDAWQRTAVTKFRVELLVERTFDDEFLRAVVDDIPLVPIVFIVMSVFCIIIFSKRDKVRSRSLVGFGAVVSVLLSIFTGYGLMWICSVPFTSMTQILPFVLFGIGLDDAFILTGSYSRTDPTKDPRSRIYDTTQDVGVSITLTTITSAAAFAMGCISTVPGVFWLCLYAFPTLILIYLYQLTFFVAVIVVDERRVQQNRRDCCVWITVKSPDDDDNEQGDESNEPSSEEATDSEPVPKHMTPVDRFMHSYAEFILRPWVKVLVVLAFVALTIACGFSASQLEQEFVVADVLPDDSYAADFLDAMDTYSARSPVIPHAYFRFVNQSDPNVWKQMESYLEEMVEIDAVPFGPDRFWVVDFQKFVNETDLSDLSFNQKLDLFLQDPAHGYLYGDDIVRDENGTITASRVMFNMDNVDIGNIKQQIDTLADQRAVTEAQPINQGRNYWAFFSYEESYGIWEFYTASADEIMKTTIYGIAAVTGVTFLLIPHWSAALFVFPLISILYLDLLGVLQWAGLNVDPVTYISLLMSIGLFVDFLMHVLLRYYECYGNRREKVVETLTTMGSSILIGGISTFLGTLPLAFSSSAIFQSIFIAFLGLVTLGIGHGLILLPVILATIGPEDHVKPSVTDEDDSKRERRGTAMTEKSKS